MMRWLREMAALLEDSIPITQTAVYNCVQVLEL